MAFSRVARVVAFVVYPSLSLRVDKVEDGSSEDINVGGEPVSPYELLPEGVIETAPEARTLKKYDKIVKDVQRVIKGLSSKCTAETCDDGEFAGCLLRMAGHDFMDFEGGRGGSDGCVDWSDPDNAGLKECLVGGRNGGELRVAWEKHLHDVSLADFFVIAAEAAMVRQRGNLKPALDFRSQFKFGRITTKDCRGQVHLPDPQDGCEATRRVFMGQLGLSARSSAALMGVHTLGRARLHNSGFNGWWSDPHNSRVFNNNFYISLLMKGWGPEETPSGKHQWGRVGHRKLKAGLSKMHPELMLNTDICLAYGDDAQFAHSQNCCAWIMPDAFPGDDAVKAMEILKTQEKNNDDLYCGFQFDRNRIMDADFAHVREWCCGSDFSPSMATFEGVVGPKADCGDPSKLQGMAAKDVMEFAVNEAAWIQEFQSAWTAVTEINQFNGLTPL